MFLDEYRHFTIKENFTIIIITITDIISFCSISLLSLFLTKEQASKGESLLICGVSIRLSSICTLLSSLLWGVIVPKYGAKKVFISGVLVARLCTTLYGAMDNIESAKIYLILAYILKGVEALGICAYFIAGYAILFSIFPEEMGVIRGLLETVAGIGNNLGPVIGELLITNGDPSLPFYVVGGWFLVVGLFSIPFIENKNDCNINGTTMKDFLKIPSVWMTLAVILVVSITANSIQSNVGNYYAKLNYFSHSAFVYLIVIVAFVMTSPIWGYISEKEINYVWMMPGGLYLTGISLFLLESVANLQILNSKIYKLMDLCVLGVALAMALVPTYRALTQGAINHGFHNTLSTHSYVCSTWSFVYTLGEILASIFNYLFINHGITTMITVIAIINIMIALLCTVFLYNAGRNRTICCSFYFKIDLQKE